MITTVEPKALRAMGTLAAQVKYVAFYLGEIRQALCVVRGGGEALDPSRRGRRYALSAGYRRFVGGLSADGDP